MIPIESNETQVPLSLTVDKLGVGGVTGLLPTVAVRNVLVGSYLDWDSMVFRMNGWVIKYKPMLEIERGHYEVLLDVASLALPIGTKLSVEYHVDNGSDVVGDDSEMFEIVRTAQQVNFLRKVATNRMEEQSGSPGKLRLYDDDATTVAMTWDLRDETGLSVLPATGTPARRSAGT